MTTTPPSHRLAQHLRERRGPPILALALTALLGIVLAICAWPMARAHLEAIAVLDLVANRPVPALIRLVTSEHVTTTSVTITTTGGPIRARLYTPLRRPDAPALVVLHGVHHLGMDEPRLIAFASAMAACGLRVLTPELPNIKDYQVTPDSIRSIGDSAVWLARQNANNQTRPVGVMGLSFSGGLALLAAADPAYQPSIKFVVAVGSQYSMAQVTQFYRTGSAPRPAGPAQVLSPHEYGALVVEYGHLEDFVPPADITALRAVLRAHLYEDAPAEKAAFAALSAAQHAEAMQLLDTASPITRAQLAATEARHIDDMAAISPRGHLRAFTTPVYLLHGAGDNIIPSAETLWMAAELPNESLRASLISPVLSHLNLDGAQPTALDRWRLIHFFALILRAAQAR